MRCTSSYTHRPCSVRCPPHLQVSQRVRAPPSCPLEALVARQARRGHPAVGHQQRHGQHEARPQESRRRQRQGVPGRPATDGRRRYFSPIDVFFSHHRGGETKSSTHTHTHWRPSMCVSVILESKTIIPAQYISVSILLTHPKWNAFNAINTTWRKQQAQRAQHPSNRPQTVRK